MQKTLSDRAVDYLPAPVRRWMKTRALRAELYGLPAGQLDDVMREMGMSASDVERLDAGHPGPQTLLPKRLQAAGLDPDYVRVAQAATMRDLERVCSRCGEFKRCQKDLDLADANDRLAAYCPNAMTVDALLVDRAR